MRARRLKHLSDSVLLRRYAEIVARDRGHTARLLACTAEVDLRRLYLPEGYPSMYAFCVHKMRMSEDIAYMRIRAARAARRFPAIFGCVADGRLHLSAVVLLAPYLTTGNAGELLEAATHRTKAEIKELLAARFPRPDLPAMVTAVPAVLGAHGQLGPDPAHATGPKLADTSGNALGLDPVDTWVSGHVAVSGSQLGPDPVHAAEPVAAGTPGNSLSLDPVDARPSGHAAVAGSQLGPDPVAAPAPRPKLAPLAPGRFALQVTIAGNTHEKLRRAQDLLSHKIPSGDLAAVLDLALDALVEKLEKRRFAKTDTPRPRRRLENAPRHIPAHVKRAVWQRDGGRCTFVGDNGRRCNASRFLEFDHVAPVARGGQATVDGIRLHCRAHNQLEAERVFGADFMNAKRVAAQVRAREHPRCGRPSPDRPRLGATAATGHFRDRRPDECPGPTPGTTGRARLETDTRPPRMPRSVPSAAAMDCARFNR